MTTAVYDALSRPIQQSDALSNTTQIAYDACGQVTLATDPEGNVTSFEYNGLNRRTRVERPAGIAMTYEYDKSSRRTGYVDALGNRTSWTYDALDRVTSVTYQDQTTVTYTYDAANNLIQIVDARGTTITQIFDEANRLTSVLAAGTGLEGPVSESYTYDGLNRLTLAQSGDPTTGMVSTGTSYDSLSRLTSETNLGRTVSYNYDDAGNPTGIGYPSGVEIGQQFDPLDRPESIGPVIGGVIDSQVDYGYRGPWLPHEKRFGSALKKTWQYDVARRPLDARTVTGTDEVFHESLSWSQRSLKASSFRGDLNGRGWTLDHDPAGRLLHAAIKAKATTTVSNNAPATGVATAESRYSYTFDTAENLKTRQRLSANEVQEDISLPPDNRNRPGSIISSATGTTTLAYDGNGNLTDKSPFKYDYDFRNRLTRVTNSDVEVARYQYDVFNRRVRVYIPAQGETPAQEVESVWSGCQEIEQYRQGQLYQRMTYGRGLDEVVRIEADSDLNGVLETDLVPHYDETGNLVLLIDSADGIVGQYGYSPMGEHMAAKADGIAPDVCQVTVANGDISIEFCEEVRKDTIEIEVRDLELPPGVQSSPAVKTTVIPATMTFPVQEGRRSHRRLVITPTDPVAAGTQMELYIPAEGVKDLFLNPSTAAYSHTFAWPATSSLTVLEDTAAPEVEDLRLSSGFLEISFSEPPELASASASIQVDSQTVSWVVGPDGYTLRSETLLATGSHTVTIAQGAPVDRDGKGLATTFEETITVEAAEPDAEYYVLPDPQVVPWTTFVNRFAFHGRPLDVETGLLYFRNRYYDPELGRFIQPDPLGYVDGPSMYQFAGYSPYNFQDPLGLCILASCEPLSDFMYRTFFENSDRLYAERREVDRLSARFARERGRSPGFGEAVAFDWVNSRYAADGQWWPVTSVGVGPRVEGGLILDVAVTPHRITNLEHRPRKTFEAIVLHKTRDYPAETVMSGWRTSADGTHFLIGRDGTIYQTASLDYFTWHTGKLKARCREEGTCSAAELAAINILGWAPRRIHERELRLKSYPDRYPFNDEAIGIEIVASFDSSTNRWQKASWDQIESMKMLVRMLQNRYGLDYADVYSHGQLSYRSGDPSEAVNLPRLTLLPLGLPRPITVP